MDSFGALTVHLDKSFAALSMARARQFNLRDSQVVVYFGLSAKSYRGFAKGLSEKLLELRQISNEMSKYFSKGLVAAGD
jgi:hypothetical protein